MRQDVHSPKNLKPEDYNLVGFIVRASSDEHADFLEQYCDDIAWTNRADFRAVEYFDAVPEPQFHGNHYHKGTCDHCGAAFLYKAVYRHNPTGEHIAVGFTCAQQTFPGTNLEQVKKLLARANKSAKSKVENAANAARWLDSHNDYQWIAEDDAHEIARGMWQSIKAGRLDLSGKQFKLLDKLRTEAEMEALNRSAEGCDRGASWDGEIQQKPKGRATVVGTVVGVKLVDDNYSYHGGQIKKLMVVAGSKKIWLTCPNAIDAQRGDGIRFDAKLNFKEDDFAIGQRPTKAEILFQRAA